ncbi:hypothetical protein PHYPSEUDO_002910 [Phytophthora pseudosyringae]|uniref:Uncharacterized protein n=1 Tax=Phytophthora pseudosyringae TaxID=221518 RepID=A0A8T1VT72_9STRA|nr:hypothetical protein PHYPSEUDO_002910 [Phytophthora pseudosyringae]
MLCKTELASNRLGSGLYGLEAHLVDSELRDVPMELPSHVTLQLEARCGTRQREPFDDRLGRTVEQSEPTETFGERPDQGKARHTFPLPGCRALLPLPRASGSVMAPPPPSSQRVGWPPSGVTQLVQQGASHAMCHLLGTDRVGGQKLSRRGLRSVAAYPSGRTPPSPRIDHAAAIKVSARADRNLSAERGQIPVCWPPSAAPSFVSAQARFILFARA